MNKLRFILFLILWFCLLSHPSWAKKVYVTDTLKITLRTGPSIENKIIAMLPSGQSLEVIKTQGDWNLVRLVKKDGKNKEGWVLRRYLVSHLPWEIQAKSLKRENAQLKEKISSLEKQFKDKMDNYLKLNGAYKTAQGTVQKLTKEKHELISSERKKIFTIVGLSLLFGLVVGLIIGRRKKRHRSSLYY
jgi:SH3 domain protein